MTDKLSHDEIRALSNKLEGENGSSHAASLMVWAAEALDQLLTEIEQLKQEKAEQVEAAYKEGKREDLDYDDYSEKDIDECWQSSQAYRKVKDENS